MDFIVKRSEWYRGHRDGSSLLREEDGRKCCIGFVGQQCGIKDSELLGQKAVGGSSDTLTSKWPKWFFSPNAIVVHHLDSSDALYHAYYVNDNSDITDVDREAKLSQLFSLNGDTISFVD